MTREGFYLEKMENIIDQWKLKKNTKTIGMNIYRSSAGSKEELEDKGQAIGDWKNHTGR